MPARSPRRERPHDRAALVGAVQPRRRAAHAVGPHGDPRRPSYQSTTLRQADALEDRASQTFDKGEQTKHDSNQFIQVTVVLASAMFFGGIVQVFRMPRARVALMAVSVPTCAWALMRVVSLPIHH